VSRQGKLLLAEHLARTAMLCFIIIAVERQFGRCRYLAAKNLTTASSPDRGRCVELG
jgi:hypothetical protein